MRETVVTEDVAEEQRWPDWCEAVLGLDLRSSISFRLFLAAGGDETFGSLNMYSVRPHAFDAHARALEQFFVPVARGLAVPGPGITFGSAENHARIMDGLEALFDRLPDEPRSTPARVTPRRAAMSIRYDVLFQQPNGDDSQPSGGNAAGRAGGGSGVIRTVVRWSSSRPSHGSPEGPCPRQTSHPSPLPSLTSSGPP